MPDGVCNPVRDVSLMLDGVCNPSSLRDDVSLMLDGVCNPVRDVSLMLDGVCNPVRDVSDSFVLDGVFNLMQPRP
jgi:hypothetical protein